MTAQPTTRPLTVEALTPDAFAPFGTVIPPMDDGVEFGAHDAQLDLGQGTPRFYTMRIPGRGLTVSAITRHQRVTQALAATGGHPWTIAVAPPDSPDDPGAEPDIDAIRAFEVPGDTAIMLAIGTWHAGPLFAGPDRSFFNLELADTNVVDHQTSSILERYGITLELVSDES